MKHLNDYLDPKYTKTALYVIGTAGGIAVLLYILSWIPSLAVKLGSFTGWLAAILLPVFWGFVIAYILMPYRAWIEKQLCRTKLKDSKKLHSLSVVIAFLTVAAAVILLLSLVISAMTSQLQVVSLESFTAWVEGMASSLQSFADSVTETLGTDSQVSGSVSEWIKKAVSAVVNGVTGNVSKITSFFSTLLFSVIFSVYFLLDYENIGNYWGKVFRTIFGQKAMDRWNEFVHMADRVFSGYIRGQTIDAILMAVLIGGSLSIVGVNMAPVIGIFAGIGNLIPYVGPIVAYAMTILSCMVAGEYGKLVAAVIVLVIVQGIDGNVINPKLLGDNVDIHPMYVVVALLVGESAAGLMGMLFGVPVAALLKEAFDKSLQKVNEKKEGKGNGTVYSEDGN